VELLKNHEDSNFSLIKKMQQKFLAWGETTYIGYNSLGFDERFLRQSLYQCALPPYLTNTNGNKRGDALKLIHSAAAVSPNSFVRPLNDDTGKITFKLEKFAPANGIVHDNAHDALGDVEATIGVCKIIKERCPDVWEAAMQTTSKQDVYKFINDDRIFCASRYFRGKEYTNGLAYLATDPTYQNHVYCFDLKTDPDLIFDLDRTELKKLFKGKNKCFQLIKANEQPILLDEKYLMQSEEFRDTDLNVLQERMQKVRNNKNFIEKFTNLLIDMNEDKSFVEDQTERTVEQRIFDGFPDNKDNYLMQDFQAAEWEKRYDIALKITDNRIQEFAKRVIYNEKPELLPKNELKKRDQDVASKLLTMDKVPWNTIPDAMKEIDDLRETEGDHDIEILQEIDEYIQELQEDHNNKLNA
jgi:exodeoxyribonuclease-1